MDARVKGKVHILRHFVVKGASFEHFCLAVMLLHHSPAQCESYEPMVARSVREYVGHWMDLKT